MMYVHYGERTVNEGRLPTARATLLRRHPPTLALRRLRCSTRLRAILPAYVSANSKILPSFSSGVTLLSSPASVM